MKRKLIFFLALIQVLLLPLVVCAAPPDPDTLLTNPLHPHNMSNSSGGVNAELPAAGGSDQICVFCHTPHSAEAKSTLWNRPDPKGPAGDGVFPVYGQTLGLSLGIKNDTALSGYGVGVYPNGASRMCLSCHDGTTSIGVLLDKTVIAMTTDNDTVTDLTIQGIIDLDTSHPISFNYNQDVVDFIDPSNTSYQVPSDTFTPLDGLDRMQCTTCHDPHVDTRGELGYDGLPFWRHKPANVFLSVYDDVCNSCHTDRGAGATPSPLPETHLP